MSKVPLGRKEELVLLECPLWTRIAAGDRHFVYLFSEANADQMSIS